ncbi:MAG: TolC family protein [Dysgonamonadaceae bacterium]|jgi:outer membrane protein TolC|nr:TolC family protein [Dysgonamonadaceae bacterium]
MGKKRLYLFFAAIWLIFNAYEARAQQDSLAAYLQTAAENNPGVTSAFHAYEAALQKIPQVGALQDPTLDLGFFLKPMELVEGRQVADIRLMQMFPWFGTRKAARTEAQHSAQMAFEQFRETRDQLFLDVYTQWFTLCRLNEQLSNSQKNSVLLAQLEELAVKRFSGGSAQIAGNAAQAPKGGLGAAQTNPAGAGGSMSGMSMGSAQPVSGTQSAASNSGSMGGMSSMSGGASTGLAEVLQIQLERAETENNIENLKSKIAAEKSRFNALLNRQAAAEIALPDSLAALPFLFDFEAALHQIEAQNPMLAMLDEEERMYRAKAVMDRKMSYPMFGIGLDYMLINPKSTTSSDAMSSGNQMSSMNGKDMLMPMISITLPIWRGKYRAQQKESSLLETAARERRQNTLNLLVAELYSAKQRLEEASRKIGLYRRQKELSETAYNLLVSEFSSGKSGLSEVLQVQRQLFDYELKTAEATADYNILAGEVQKLIAGFN